MLLLFNSAVIGCCLLLSLTAGAACRFVDLLIAALSLAVGAGKFPSGTTLRGDFKIKRSELCHKGQYRAVGEVWLSADRV